MKQIGNMSVLSGEDFSFNTDFARKWKEQNEKRAVELMAEFESACCKGRMIAGIQCENCGSNGK